MTDLAVSRTITSEPLGQDALLLQALSSLLELPCSVMPVLWRENMPNAEPTIAAWVDANADRVFVDSDDVAVRVVRRWDRNTIFTFRRDSWRD